MEDKKFIFAVIYLLIGLFCCAWGTVVYYSTPKLMEITKLALKASWIQFLVAFVCFMIARFFYLKSTK
ncbi:MAG: hypothetical protein WC428_02210 [Candidatus Paceibacterota bacterium]|jgi:uncharacterized membrane protein YczE